MHIKVRQRVTLRYYLVNSRAMRNESHKRRLALKDNTTTTMFHQRSVADELQSVSQALLGM